MASLELTPKQKLRHHMRDKRRAQPLEWLTEASQVICQKILHLPRYQRAKKIGLYFAQEGEVDLKDIWQDAIQHQKRCFFPRIESKHHMYFAEADANTHWVKNRFNILEPSVEAPTCEIDALDLIVLPVVAFDLACNRLGMGGGFYDRILSASSTYCIGVAYQFQCVECLVTEPWDIPLQGVLTEVNAYWSVK